MPEEPRSLVDVLENITKPDRWATPEDLMAVLSTRPSLRGMVYGYIAERKFAEYLRDQVGIAEQTIDDDDYPTVCRCVEVCL